MAKSDLRDRRIKYVHFVVKSFFSYFFSESSIERNAPIYLKSSNVHFEKQSNNSSSNETKAEQSVDIFLPSNIKNSIC